MYTVREYLARRSGLRSAHLDRLEVDWSSGAPAPAARDGRDRNTSSGLVRTPVSFPVFLNRCAGTSRARNAAGWSCYSHDPCLMLDGCESCVRLCDPCARVSPCELVPCVRCVPAVPQVSFYWNFKNTGGSRTHDRQTRTSLGSSGRQPHVSRTRTRTTSKPTPSTARVGIFTVLYCTVLFPVV